MGRCSILVRLMYSMFIFAAINTVIVKRILPPLSTLPCCYLIFESLETRGEIDSKKKKIGKKISSASGL